MRDHRRRRRSRLRETSRNATKGRKNNLDAVKTAITNRSILDKTEGK